jgi:hypothetical protein
MTSYSQRLNELGKRNNGIAPNGVVKVSPCKIKKREGKCIYVEFERIDY